MAEAPIGTDLSHFFNTAEFAVTAKIPLRDGGETTVKGMFDYSSNPMEIGVEGRLITFLAPTHEVGHLHHGDRIEVRLIPYAIQGVEPQDDGAVTLLTLRA